MVNLQQAKYLHTLKMSGQFRAWWCMPLVLALRKQRQITEFQASQVYKGSPRQLWQVTLRNPNLKKHTKKQKPKKTPSVHEILFYQATPTHKRGWWNWGRGGCCTNPLGGLSHFLFSSEVILTRQTGTKDENAGWCAAHLYFKATPPH